MVFGGSIPLLWYLLWLGLGHSSLNYTLVQTYLRNFLTYMEEESFGLLRRMDFAILAGQTLRIPDQEHFLLKKLWRAWWWP